MTARKPQKTSDDEVQNQILQAVHAAMSETALVSDPVDDQPLAETKPAAVDTKIELDRTELYLKGPTAFTA
jgi:propanediol dehydratase small subunit